MSANISAGPVEGLWLGLDTGGTFTDAVLLAGGRRVIASAKALTTPWNLAIGIGKAIRAVLEELPSDARRGDVSLVSVSTTLATNAVVENRFSPVCTLLIGFDDAMTERSGIGKRGTGAVVRIRGGHAATGEELIPLDEAAIDAAVAAHDSRVEAYAVAANFSVRNPAHELRARQIVRQLSKKPVTCAHELSSKLDAPRRALTAVLNARLTPQIRHLIEALSHVLVEETIDAPLMIVKGDGSLMRADVALEYPVETILSGPAASVVGAGFLTGIGDFVVSDMGGTTTDIAVVSNGRPAIRAEGALVGGWRTMVEAVDVRTSGLGGDSEVLFDRQMRIKVGPRKAMPLSLLAHTFPRTLEELRCLAELSHLPEFATQFAFRNPDRDAPAHLSATEKRVWEALAREPRQVSAIVRNGSGLEALRRLADAGLATIAGFTPSDAMHVLGRQEGWSREAAECGARILAIEERNGRAASAAVSAIEMCERTHEHVVRETVRVLLAAALANDPGLEASAAGGRLRRTALLEPAWGEPRACAAAGRDRRSGGCVLSRGRPALELAALDPDACVGLQRRGGRRGRRLADHRNSRQSAYVQGVSSSRSQPRLPRARARARACASHLAPAGARCGASRGRPRPARRHRGDGEAGAGGPRNRLPGGGSGAVHGRRQARRIALTHAVPGGISKKCIAARVE